MFQKISLAWVGLSKVDLALMVMGGVTLCALYAAFLL